ncbi:MAG TPA: DUF924 family protein [Candidatus Binataceae bacterium]|jgi:uncharacterized protein (DUF924 family)|nr:DUF924 family protein [Candidatus Binataceae bacterium]
MVRVEEILEFWFGAADSTDRQKVWFAPDPAFDQACTAAFLADQERAASGQLDDWMDAPSSALALILLLDQFPRNMFRGTARAFETDAKARAAAKDALARQFDSALTPIRRVFMYMPLEHSENLDDQHESLRLFRKLGSEDAALAGFVPYAERHLEVIARFGRFPHRNAVLGRVSTPPEAEFLSSGGPHF